MDCLGGMREVAVLRGSAAFAFRCAGDARTAAAPPWGAPFWIE